MKKCLFTKSTENLNTAVTVTTELGPVTVYLSDGVLDKTIKEVTDEISSIVIQAQQFADTFGFNLIDAISKGGMLNIGAEQPIQQQVRQEPDSFRKQSTQQSNGSKSSSSPTTLRTQPIPIKNNMQAAMANKLSTGVRSTRPAPAQIIENEIDAMSAISGNINNDNPYFNDGDDIINEETINPNYVAPITPHNKKQQLQRVTTPSGATFDIPSLISDETGTTNISINTAVTSEQFDKKMRQIEEASKAGHVVSMAAYTVKKCGFCKGAAIINDQPCPKCKGEGSIVVA